MDIITNELDGLSREVKELSANVQQITKILKKRGREVENDDEEEEDVEGSMRTPP
jgi:hypothetical protein